MVTLSYFPQSLQRLGTIGNGRTHSAVVGTRPP